MKKRNIIGGAVVLLLAIGGMASCGSNDDVNTGGSNSTATTKQEAKVNTETTAQPKDDGSKKFNANIAQNTNGLNINIADIKIENNKVSIGMNIANTTQQKLTFYPDQGSIVIGDMQLDANMFEGSSDISGDVNAGVKKDGVIVFDVPEGKTLDVAKVTQMTLNFGDVYNDSTYDSKPVTITVPVK